MGDYNTETDLRDDYSRDNYSRNEPRRSSSDADRGESSGMKNSASTWVYVVIFILLFFIFLFVILIYGKVKGFAVNPASTPLLRGAEKPGKTFTGTATTTMTTTPENDQDSPSE